MSRYVDVDEIKYDINLVWFHRQDIPDDAVDEMLELIDKEPSVDVEPVRHGKWIKVDEQPYFRKHFNLMCCSVCHRKGYKSWNYCPNCGAKMDGEE